MAGKLATLLMAAALALGLAPSIAVAAQGGELQAAPLTTMSDADLPSDFGDEGYRVYANGETGWSLLYVDGKSATLTPEIELYYEGDGGKTLINKDAYTVSYAKTWWDEEADEEKSETVEPPFGITSEAGMGDEIRISAVAKNGSGFTGETQPISINVYDKYTLAGFAVDCDFPNAERDDSEAGQETHFHMWHYYYVVNYGVAVQPTPLVGETASQPGAQLDSRYYDIAYYDWAKDSGWERLESAKLDGAPTQVGKYYVTFTGKDPYYGSIAVDFDIVQAHIADVAVSSIKTQTYTGNAIEPTPEVKLGTTTLKSGTDYTISYKNNINAGTATVTVTGKGNYTGAKSATFKINKAKQPMTAKAVNKTAKIKTLKKKAVTLTKFVTVKKKQGTLSYKNVSKTKKLKKFKVNAKNGTITVPKGTKKGTYKIKVKVTAKGNANYKSGSKTVTVKIKVK